jgi:hypothetical protein
MAKKTAHYKEVCEFGRVHAQCRCIGEKKTINIRCTMPDSHMVKPSHSSGIEVEQITGGTIDAGKTQDEVDEAVGYTRNGMSQDPIRTLPTCQICGAVFMDRKRHVEWHVKLGL